MVAENDLRAIFFKQDVSLKKEIFQIFKFIITQITGFLFLKLPLLLLEILLYIITVLDLDLIIFFLI